MREPGGDRQCPEDVPAPISTLDNKTWIRLAGLGGTVLFAMTSFSLSSVCIRASGDSAAAGAAMKVSALFVASIPDSVPPGKGLLGEQEVGAVGTLG